MQTELFDINSQSQTCTESETPGAKQHLLERTFLSLRLDQTIGIVLVLMVFYAVVFSLGFEKGKRLIRHDQVIKAVNPKPVDQSLPPISKNLILYEEPQTELVETAVVATVPQPAPSAVTATSTSENRSISSARPDGKYTIQHVIYLTRSAAEKEVQKLTQKGEKAFIVPSGKYMQICLSGFPSKKEADQYLRQLRSQNIIASDAYVRNMPA